MGQTIHHHAIKNSAHCPVKAIARRIHHILAHGGTPTTLICAVATHTPQSQSPQWDHVTANDMRKAIRKTIKQLDLHKAGIDPDLVGVHSLRAGGAMALKLNNVNDTTIMKMGRWTSLTFLQYIHNQIAHLSVDLSTKMNTKINFTNIAAIEKA